jgi:hypothetical protein
MGLRGVEKSTCASPSSMGPMTPIAAAASARVVVDFRAFSGISGPFV